MNNDVRLAVHTATAHASAVGEHDVLERDVACAGFENRNFDIKGGALPGTGEM